MGCIVKTIGWLLLICGIIGTLEGDGNGIVCAFIGMVAIVAAGKSK